MGHAVFRYHKQKAPNGTIFDSDDLPSEKDGWVDSPKKIRTMEIDAGGVPVPTLIGDLPDPRAFFSIKSYIGVVHGMLPNPPTPAEAAARGISEERLEEIEREILTRRKGAMIYYADLKHGAKLPSDRSPALLMTDCMELDENAEAGEAAGDDAPARKSGKK